MDYANGRRGGSEEHARREREERQAASGGLAVFRELQQQLLRADGNGEREETVFVLRAFE